MTGPSIYLDHAATTPLAREAQAAMAECAGLVGNPSATHAPGRRAAARLESAREAVAAAIGAPAETIVFTSGATEANNLAVLGMARHPARRGSHVVSVKTEHRAVLDPLRALAREGFEIDWLEPDATGRVSAEDLARRLRDDTALVSVMHVNNETGTVQDVAALAAACRRRAVPFHTDAVQSVGKLDVDVAALGVDALSLSAHKLHGPVGVGALYLRPGCRVAPLMYGGGQEGGLRPGTVPVHQVAGFAAALGLAVARRAADREHVAELKARLWQGLEERVGGVRANGPLGGGSPWILNVAFDGVEGESLRAAVPEIAVSSGSACNAATGEPSFVLRALGLDDQLAGASLRFSFGRDNTKAEIDRAVALVAAAVARLRAMAPRSAA